MALTQQITYQTDMGIKVVLNRTWSSVKEEMIVKQEAWSVGGKSNIISGCNQWLSILATCPAGVVVTTKWS